MGKREAYASKLEVVAGDRPKLEQLLCKGSALPGRRSNLELAAALADRFAERGAGEADWQMLRSWAALAPADAPTNSPREFLPFVAVQSLGALFDGADVARRELIFALVRAAAQDPRWRTREAAAMALQRIGEAHFEALQGLVAAWLEQASPMEQRAIVAALAHPPLYERRTAERTSWALEIAGHLLHESRGGNDAQRASEERRVLRKGLEYAISVLVAAEPERGFRFLRKWAGVDDLAIKKIIAANLRKSRLAKRYPDQVQEIGEILSWGL